MPRTWLALLVLVVGCNAPAVLPTDPTPSLPPPPPPPAEPNPLPGFWTALAPMPESRWQLAATELNGVVYIAGGVRAPDFLAPRQIHAYTPDSDRWTTVGVLRLSVRAPAVAATGGRIYVVGGFFDDPWAPVRNLQILDPSSGTVTDGPPMPTAKGGAAIAVYQGRLHGGSSSASSRIDAE